MLEKIRQALRQFAGPHGIQASAESLLVTKMNDKEVYL